MSLQLRKIAHRRVELVSIAESERSAFAGNNLWSAGAVIFDGLMRNSSRDIGSRIPILRYAIVVFTAVWPQSKLIRWAVRGVSIWMTFSKIRKKLSDSSGVHR
jgi:hypothetical protein